ncbi:phospho-2-dehydro-3-deoxyheptonate aldolase AroF [Melissococcus plutonius]|uniref:3-deoxy-7-phosphoheptulonate synthase n=1 Tax=Melissococcus plutonius TaxID=33970 RepID=UPI00065E4E6F|nr:3-deoxy-7-phosphoheptulonate synthase [Melissococcus plutonius]AIM24990.1 phospho-2-dehydro-3-deoxyheptonate aldolase AroF [Melissococcus plutonius S1]KMT25151.1 phospho-2-dehydro-3-deoxyheptonate aldolase AroF [Melissococcus plutonius]KMT26788.1 phospho-2-dehydro-3-deoxyheptonate aldolase AroF [Melissococcus plutonius]KMT28038.1 phospho-2-dehydro-3-deoxyheptonate aldolase AroF [Melissococcus plutonius]KMT29811.1 phospho-2-dehydro-3-deoxyheptonate aldolase AroF [Melissococcus plutonius]
MFIIMQPNATSEQINQIIEHIKANGLDVRLSKKEKQISIQLMGNEEKMHTLCLDNYPGIAQTFFTTSSYKLVSRAYHLEDTIVEVNDLKIGDGTLSVMAGPCAVESLDQVRECARIAKKGGATILRGGAFKPRTSPYAFQGLEEEGLSYLRQAADEYDLKVITEVMDEAHIEMVAHYSDILQIGARNMQNFRLLQAVGKTQLPIGLKRGIAATIDEWLNAAEYIAVQGNQNIIFIERGIRTFETATRNTLDLSAVPLLKQISHFPVIVDPSHGVGKWQLVSAMARAGIAAGSDGLIVEIHPDPSNAWSDGPQSLNEKNYLAMMNEVHIIEHAMQEIQKLNGE